VNERGENGEEGRAGNLEGEEVIGGRVGGRERVVPSVRLSTVGSRTFSVAAPRIWNALSEETSAQSLTSFRQHLKTWLFRQSYQTSSSDLSFTDCLTALLL